jgi:hypothetical protein
MLVDEFLRQMGIQKIPTDPRAMRAAMRVAGLMSGTSGDGIDVAIVDIVDDCTRPLLTLVAFDTVPYAQSDRDFLFHLFSEQASVRDLCQGNFRFGRLFGEALLRVCESSGIPLGSIELIGSHGQTVWHEIDSETGESIKRKRHIWMFYISYESPRPRRTLYSPPFLVQNRAIRRLRCSTISAINYGHRLCPRQALARALCRSVKVR